MVIVRDGDVHLSQSCRAAMVPPAALVPQPQLCSDIPELQDTSEQAQTKFKSEKQSRKQLELKVTSLEEELADLRAEKESLEKVNCTEFLCWPYISRDSCEIDGICFSFKNCSSMCSLYNIVIQVIQKNVRYLTLLLSNLRCQL